MAPVPVPEVVAVRLYLLMAKAALAERSSFIVTMH
jgi:hypothetical protein